MSDRRRINHIYQADICPLIKQKECLKGDACEMAHSNVERLYHVEKYKTKFCQSPPGECVYGSMCSFAHSEIDIKIRLIHKFVQDAEFFMFYFKTEWCPFQNKNHNKAQCVYAHNWQDFRRKPHLFDYDPRNLC